MPAFCPLCATDDRTATHTHDDGTPYAVCMDPSHGSGGYVWETTPTPTRARTGAVTTTHSEGIGAELDIWSKLLACFELGEDYVSYGEIEDRLIARYPEEATVLLHRYGHRWRDPEHRAGQYSMSVYLALRLRELEKDGMLELEWGKATGPWAYNDIISHWRLATPPRT